MDLTFDIGEHERHSVHYHFNQSSGFGAISVDGKTVKRIFQMFALSTIVHCKFSVGNEENHKVDIQRERKRAIGGFLPQTYRVIVDGQLLVEKGGARGTPGRWNRGKIPPMRDKRSRLARFGIGAGAVIVFVGIALATNGLVRYEDATPPGNQTAQATGIVSSASTTDSKCTNTASFTVAGRRHQASTRISMDYCHYAVGDPVGLKYDPSDPNSASIVLPTSVTLGEVPFGGIVALVGAVISVAVPVASKKRIAPST